MTSTYNRDRLFPILSTIPNLNMVEDEEDDYDEEEEEDDEGMSFLLESKSRLSRGEFKNRIDAPSILQWLRIYCNYAHSGYYTYGWNPMARYTISRMCMFIGFGGLLLSIVLFGLFGGENEYPFKVRPTESDRQFFGCSTLADEWAILGTHREGFEDLGRLMSDCRSLYMRSKVCMDISKELDHTMVEDASQLIPTQNIFLNGNPFLQCSSHSWKWVDSHQALVDESLKHATRYDDPVFNYYLVDHGNTKLYTSNWELKISAVDFISMPNQTMVRVVFQEEDLPETRGIFESWSPFYTPSIAPMMLCNIFACIGLLTGITYGVLTVSAHIVEPTPGPNVRNIVTLGMILPYSSFVVYLFATYPYSSQVLVSVPCLLCLGFSVFLLEGTHFMAMLPILKQRLEQRQERRRQRNASGKV